MNKAPACIPLSRITPLFVSVGCPVMDELLRGGLQCGSITEITGEFGSGKTQFCLQCCLSVQWKKEHGGLEGSAIYIYTEGSPPVQRLQELAQEQLSAGRGYGLQALQNILIHQEVASADDLWVCLNQLTMILEGENKLPVRLLVIDSIANIFRQLSDRPTITELHERTNQMFRTSALLKRLSFEWEFAVLVTNQVVDAVKDGSSLDTNSTKQSALGSLDRAVLPSLGWSWANCINTRLFATREYRDGGLLRTLQVDFSPYLPPSRCNYSISKRGIAGIACAGRT